MTYNLKERIEELKKVRAIMEEDAEKYYKMNYSNISEHFLTISKAITNEIHKIINEGGQN